MRTLDIRNGINIELPISSVCIADLPEDEFHPDSSSFSNDWIIVSKRLVWLSYFGLLLKDKVRIEYKFISKKLLFGLFPFRSLYYIPKLVDNQKLEAKTGWFETQIIASINNCQPKSERDYHNILSLQFNLLFDNILEAYEVYNSPEKKIVERVILYDKHSLWNHSYNSKSLISKRTIKLIIGNSTKEYLLENLNKILNLEEELIEKSAEFRKFKKMINRKISIEIGKRNLNNEYSG